MDEYLFDYLTGRFGIDQLVSEWGYNLLHASERYSHDDRLGTFHAVLTKQVRRPTRAVNSDTLFLPPQKTVGLICKIDPSGSQIGIKIFKRSSKECPNRSNFVTTHDEWWNRFFTSQLSKDSRRQKRTLVEPPLDRLELVVTGFTQAAPCRIFSHGEYFGPKHRGRIYNRVN